MLFFYIFKQKKTALNTHYQQLKRFLRHIFPISIQTLKGWIFTKNATFTHSFFRYRVVFTPLQVTPTVTPTVTPSPFLGRNVQVFPLPYYSIFQSKTASSFTGI